VFERRLPTALRERQATLAAWQGFDSTAVSTLLRLLADAFAWTDQDVQRFVPMTTSGRYTISIIPNVRGGNV
jgi:hypothetical protein